jgi:hypothetical protein
MLAIGTVCATVGSEIYEYSIEIGGGTYYLAANGDEILTPEHLGTPVLVQYTPRGPVLHSIRPGRGIHRPLSTKTVGKRSLLRGYPHGFPSIFPRNMHTYIIRKEVINVTTKERDEVRRNDTIGRVIKVLSKRHQPTSAESINVAAGLQKMTHSQVADLLVLIEDTLR